MSALIDIGVNLTNRAFRHDLDEVLARAEAAGVREMVITGTSLRASETARSLANEKTGGLYATAGVHPHGAKECDDSTLDQLRALASDPRVVAIGECGLDYNRDFSPRPVQDRWFEAQIELAIQLGMPLFLHERDAHERFCEILGAHRSALGAAVIHCFTGTAEELRAYLDLDLHIGITGWICDERRGLHLREVVSEIPIERLMIETDAPYLTPRNMRPKPKKGRNEPAFLPHVLRAVAAAKGLSDAEIAEGTTRTARAFFGLPELA